MDDIAARTARDLTWQRASPCALAAGEMQLPREQDASMTHTYSPTRYLVAVPGTTINEKLQDAVDSKNLFLGTPSDGCSLVEFNLGQPFPHNFPQTAPTNSLI